MSDETGLPVVDRGTPRRLSILLLLMFTVASLGLSSARAHHSGSMFDQTKTVTVSGTVTLFLWSSPHSWIELMVVGPDGKAMSKCSVELGPPSGLIRKGWKLHTLKPGDKITVTFHPVRSGVLGGSYLSAARADGTKLGDG